MNRDAKIVIGILAVVSITAIIFRKKLKRGIQYIGNIMLKPAQEAYIMHLHPAAKKVFREFIAEAEKRGYSIIITSGYRTFAEQQKQYILNSNNAQPGYSFHNFGMAIDINMIGPDGSYIKSTAKNKWEQSGIPALAKKLGFRWGGDFVGYYDPVHFDLGYTYSINDLRNKALTQYGSNNENIKGNNIKLT